MTIVDNSMMSQGCRIDGFTGTQEQYIAYLEGQVTRYRNERSAAEIFGAPVREVTQMEHGVTIGDTAHPPHRDRSSNSRSVNSGFKIWSPYQKKPSQDQAWMSMAKGLVRATPTAKEWASKTREQGISSDAHAIVFLISNDFEAQPYVEAKADAVSCLPKTDCTAIESLKIHAQAAAQRQDRARLTLRFTRFSHFLILSASLVLLDHGTPKDDVLSVVRICIGRDISERYAMDILRIMRFLNRIIDTLNAHGWGDRASELLLIWDRTFASYHALCSYSENSLKFLQAQLCSEPYVNSCEIERAQGEGRMPLFVPSLVHALTLKTVHVARISHTLGYQFAGMLGDEMVNPWQYFNRGSTTAA